VVTLERVKGAKFGQETKKALRLQPRWGGDADAQGKPRHLVLPNYAGVVRAVARWEVGAEGAAGHPRLLRAGEDRAVPDYAGSSACAGACGV